ncbi:M14 family metallopeptidase [Arhodomonas sp. AD133]|uniref:M14 family metallopeptidase n=1 Tax=Arhodomonas sp. AD133 TaxID=3415009 RepID=UPI003EBF0214
MARSIDPSPHRREYPDYATLSRVLRHWAAAHPAHVRLQSLARTPAGRELWLITVGPGTTGDGPAVWIDGNMHAAELAGCNAAMAIAETAIRLHTADAADIPLPAPVLTKARRVTFHILPRLSPDGAEAVLQSGRVLRSVPRNARRHGDRPRWHPADIDGDGLALTMRVPDPTGDYVEDEKEPGLMRPREIDDAGPFFRLYPEGRIEPFDGRTVPQPDFLSDNSPDLNRNFPYDWAPEEDQHGAGPYPLSEPQSRAVAEFAQAHPQIFAWLNLHTFGGVFIRPPGAAADTSMDRDDLAMYRQVETWADALTGYPMVSGYEEFTYEPGRPLHGDLTDFAFHQQGCLAMVCELWDIFARLGVERQHPFVTHYTRITQDDLRALARWDREHNQGRILKPWRAVDHPQLGDVEVGGWDPRVGLFNPPYEQLPHLCDAIAAFWLRVAALAPCVTIDDLYAAPLGDDLTRITATVRNTGYLSTYGMPSARRLEWNHPLYAHLEAEGPEPVTTGGSRQKVGHLHGWGHGRFNPRATLFYPFSPGNTGERRLSWLVRGHGDVTIRVTGPRTGTVSASIHITG